MAIFYHSDITKTAHAFDTTRKGADIATALTSRGWQIETATPIRREIATRYHAEDYIDAVITGEPLDLAESQGFAWDEYMWQSVAAQAGAMVDAAHHAATYGRAYALGAGFHHARIGIGAGFCTLNGLAIAAGEILATYPQRNVIILDVDAHCGGGTMSICATWERVLHVDIQTNRFDGYATKSPHRQVYVDDASTYLDILKSTLNEIKGSIKPHDLLIYNAGMDIHEDCRIGGRDGITTDIVRQREQYVSDWAAHHALHVAACLAGGYAGGDLTHEELINLHVMSVEIMLNNNSLGVADR